MGVYSDAGISIDILRSIDKKVSDGFTLTGDAEVTDVLAGKKFYKDAAYTELTGTMVDQDADIACTSSAIDGTTLKLLVPEGYYDGTVYVTLTDADFVAAKIKDGVTLFGLLGTYAP